MIQITLADLPTSLMEQMEGPVPPVDFISNGCSYSLDQWGGVDLRPACHWHDYAYQQGGCKRDRALADAALYRNLRRCDLGRFMANVYYRRVRLFGVVTFNWKPGKVPLNPWHYLLLFFNRYLQW
ncbi:hypothetical protein [Gimesia panareensis]|uniref:hypothetical protein n=1 Tax=Gimesia panareensis TaxID=2527978 RepID=UPI0011895309|nr:hypothetical protein [Gimesia panareensis]QDU53479.1 hypothetical protein Pan110_58710 [Gimesia panareensis]